MCSNLWLVVCVDKKNIKISSKWLNFQKSVPKYFLVAKKRAMWPCTNVSKVWNYYAIVKSYICLGFLQWFCSLQINWNYVPTTWQSATTKTASSWIRLMIPSLKSEHWIGWHIFFLSYEYHFKQLQQQQKMDKTLGSRYSSEFNPDLPVSSVQSNNLTFCHLIILIDSETSTAASEPYSDIYISTHTLSCSSCILGLLPVF